MKKTILLLCVMLWAGACSDNKTDNPHGGGSPIEGSVQKGQYIKGSGIVAYRLDDTLTATGESYPSQIADDLGRFSINGRIGGGYLELRASGYYYNENTQALSDGTLSLQAIAPAAKSPVNVNLLTTLSSLRIKHLAAAGTPFEKAVAQAEKEVLKAFGIDEETISARFSDMDISKGRNADAALLAVSCLLQQDRNTAELSAVISEIASRIAQDGALPEALRSEIGQKAANIDIGRVISGLMDFYTQKQLDEYEIPPFYEYLDLNGDGKADGDAPVFLFLDAEPSVDPYAGVSETGYTSEYRILSSYGFTADADCDWIEVEKTGLKGNVWSVRYTVLPNQGKMRQGTLAFRKADGTLITTRTIRQRSVYQRLFLYSGIQPRSAETPLLAGEEVSVNGTAYVVENDPQQGPYVDVTKAENYTLCYPIGTVTPGNDIYCCTVAFPAAVPGTAAIPYYGVLAPFRNSAVGNPARMELQICTALLRIDLSGFAEKDAAERIELEADADTFLSGKATYLIYEDQPVLDPSYTPSDPVFTDRSNRVWVGIPDGGTPCEVCIYPQHLGSLKVSVYDRSGKVIRQQTLSGQELRRSCAYTIQIN